MQFNNSVDKAHKFFVEQNWVAKLRIDDSLIKHKCSKVCGERKREREREAPGVGGGGGDILELLVPQSHVPIN